MSGRLDRGRSRRKEGSRRNASGGHDRTAAFRRRILLGVWLMAGVGLLARAFEVQVLQGSHWASLANQQQRMPEEVLAGRGSIVDRAGVPLAVSSEIFRVALAPQELVDPAEAARLLSEALEIPLDDAEALTRSSRRWVSVAGRFAPRVRETLSGVRGLYVERETQRFYPHGPLAQGAIGRVVDQRGLGGIEAEFEAHLAGSPGAEIVGRDSNGQPIPGETWVVEAPRPGGSVVLTLDLGVQEIAREALREAIELNDARGGDLLVTDPRTGEILAMVSMSEEAPGGLGVIGTPYEPGSTIKPFTVAALLREGRASLSDSIDTGNGRLTLYGRDVSDVGTPVGVVTIARALQVSSNVAIATAASSLTAEEQFEALRDFGFGSPTGIQLPGESAGRLRLPAEWSLQSSASLAIGYEIAVTPLQLAMAYGALANGGVLMEPLIVKELRDERGRVVRTFRPQVVRQVLSPEIAGQLTAALVEAVEDGTGTQARLATFAVAGKSGTARAYGEDGYDTGEYMASFVGFFPAEAPQLVVYVKLDRPRGSAYYGGTTAAPVTRSTLEAILAARNPPLDRGALAAIARDPDGSPRVEPGRGSPASLFASTERLAPAVDLAPAVGDVPIDPAAAGITVPDLSGILPRDAARRLHSLGLHVVWETAGTVESTLPTAGSQVRLGTDVHLVMDARSAIARAGVDAFSFRSVAGGDDD